MTNVDTPDRRRRNRKMLIGIFAVFFGTMLVAGLLRFSGWQPEGSKSHGEMLDPPLDLRERTLALADGGDYAWNPGERTWRLAVAPPADCTDACARVARDLDVVWRSLGHRADQVEVLWLCAEAGCSVPSPLREDRALKVLRPDPGVRMQLPGVDAGVAIYVIDPHGFVILRYPPGADAAGIRADLGKLLRLI